MLNGLMWLLAILLGVASTPLPAWLGWFPTRQRRVVCVLMGEQGEIGVGSSALFILVLSQPLPLQSPQAPFPTDCAQLLVPTVTAKTLRFSLESYSGKFFPLSHFCVSYGSFESLMQPILMSVPPHPTSSKRLWGGRRDP